VKRCELCPAHELHGEKPLAPVTRGHTFFQPFEFRHHVLVYAISVFMQVSDLEFGFNVHLVLERKPSAAGELT
jgi:hypothetical protein